MRSLEAIILASVAAFTPGCGASKCDPPTGDFALEAPVTVSELAPAVRAADAGPALVDCHTACRQAYARDTGWEVTRVDTCADDLVARTGRPPTEVAGTVRCSGRAAKYLCEGRRPVGHVERAARGAGLARHLSACAYLEASAVLAFDDLVIALSAAGAPRRWIDRCRRARNDEASHARVVGALARRSGGAIARPRRAATPPSILELARSNAAEGCVLEAWAAVRASWVATHASDPELRATYAADARDEIQHAQLAWDLHAWWLATLEPCDVAVLRAAQTAALADLADQAARCAELMPPELGLPDRSTSYALARAFSGELESLAA